MNIEEGQQVGGHCPPIPHAFMCCFTMKRQTDTTKFLARCLFHGVDLLVGMERWMDEWLYGGWAEEEGKTNFLY